MEAAHWIWDIGMALVVLMGGLLAFSGVSGHSIILIMGQNFRER